MSSVSSDGQGNPDSDVDMKENASPMTERGEPPADGMIRVGLSSSEADYSEADEGDDSFSPQKEPEGENSPLPLEEGQAGNEGQEDQPVDNRSAGECFICSSVEGSESCLVCGKIICPRHRLGRVRGLCPDHIDTLRTDGSVASNLAQAHPADVVHISLHDVGNGFGVSLNSLNVMPLKTLVCSIDEDADRLRAYRWPTSQALPKVAELTGDILDTFLEDVPKTAHCFLTASVPHMVGRQVWKDDRVREAFVEHFVRVRALIYERFFHGRVWFALEGAPHWDDDAGRHYADRLGGGIPQQTNAVECIPILKPRVYFTNLAMMGGIPKALRSEALWSHLRRGAVMAHRQKPNHKVKNLGRGTEPPEQDMVFQK
jgi:hypothetical protein